MAAYSSETYTGDGSTVQYNVPWPYIAQPHVLVYVDGELQTLTTDYTWHNASTIEFVTAPAINATITIKRNSSRDTRLVDYGPSGTLTEAVLDRDSLQAFYLAQEAFAEANETLIELGTVYLGGKAADPTTDNDGDALVAGTTYFNTATNTLRVYDGSSWSDALASIDASAVEYTHGGTSSVMVPVDDVLRDRVHVKHFGAVGDWNGSTGTDDTAAIQAAVNAGLEVHFGGNGENYKVTAAITLRSGQRLVGHGATLTQRTSNVEILNVEAKSNIDISGFTFVGLGSDYSESDSNRGTAIQGGTSGENIHVHHNTFLSFGYTTAHFRDQNKCSFTNNTVVGPGTPTLTAVTSGRNYGVLFNAGCNGALIADNDISRHAQGIRIEACNDSRLVGNRLHDITGQHGIYAGSEMRNLVIADNVVYNCDLCGIKVQAQDYSGSDNTGITITGNTVYDCDDQGILVCNAASPATYKCRDVAIIGNTIRDVGGAGINTDSTVDATISGNVIDLTGQSGITIDENSSMLIEGNFITRTGNTAIRDIAACSNITLRGNVIKDCATANTGGDEYGIYINGGGSEYVIDGNIITDANANMEFGIFIGANINASLTLTNNLCANATSAGVRFGNTAACRQYRNNRFDGTSLAANNDPVLPAVASAATIALPIGHDVVSVTGTTTITSITANGHSGRRVTLVFTGALTVTRGSNLLLNQSASDFVTTANDTLTLACDGTYWYEIARSAN